MRIHVTLNSSLADRLPGGQGDIECGEQTTVDDLAGLLALPGGQCIFVVNGTAVRGGEALADGDRVRVFPPVSGG